MMHVNTQQYTPMNTSVTSAHISTHRYTSGLPECLAFRNAMRVCKPFHYGVRAFRFGVLAWRSVCGVPAWRSGVLGVLWRSFRSEVVFERSHTHTHTHTHKHTHTHTRLYAHTNDMSAHPHQSSLVLFVPNKYESDNVFLID